MSLAEVMTIMVLFHLSHYRDFKTFYLHHVMRHMRSEFPKLVSYTRFVELMKISAIPLMLFMKGLSKQQTDNYFADSTPIKVCQIEHTRHRSPINALVNVFSGLVAYALKPRKPSISQKILPWPTLLLMSN